MNTVEGFLDKTFSSTNRIVHEGWAVLAPKSYVKHYFKKATNKKLNLKDPKDYNEKIQWLKIYSDISQWSDLADKYKVREYIEQCGLSDILVTLYGVWEKAEEIDFGLLPDRFVLKANNSCGRVILVKDKNQLDIDETRELLNKWVKEKKGLISFEPHYWNIDRRIIAEELLQDNSTKGLSSSLIDYKFWCIHGEPIIIMILYDRDNMTIGSEGENSSSHVRASVYDLEWNLQPEIIAGPLANDMPLIIPKPKCFDEMITICRILSKPFPQVRVDLYEVNNRVYFGELTFTPGGGMDYFSSEYFMKMGQKMDLSTVKRRSKWFII
jgi:hypothetical protein